MAVFNEDVYFANKLASLNATPGGTQYTDASMREAFSNAGLTAEQHYEQFGRDEQINPYAAGGLTAPTTGATTTPTAVQSQTFDEGIYWQNKADDLNANSQSGRTNWDATAVKNYVEDGGFTAQSHYEQFGKDEGVSPYGYQEAEVVPPPIVDSRTYGDVANEMELRDGLDYVDPNKSTVAGQLEQLFADESSYLEQARLGAERQAASRGMLNSSMAAGAGEAAAIQAALPIAEQDAGTYAAAQGRQQEGEITSTIQGEAYNAQGRLQDQAALQTMDQTALEGDIELAIQDAGYTSQLDMQNAAYADDRKAIELSATIQSARDTWTQAATMERDAILAENTRLITQMGIDSTTATAYSQTLSNLTDSTLYTVNNILNNMDIGDVPAAMESLKLFLGSTELGKNIYLPDVDLVGGA